MATIRRVGLLLAIFEALFIALVASQGILDGVIDRDTEHKMKEHIGQHLRDNANALAGDFDREQVNPVRGDQGNQQQFAFPKVPELVKTQPRQNPNVNDMAPNRGKFQQPDMPNNFIEQQQLKIQEMNNPQQQAMGQQQPHQPMIQQPQQQRPYQNQQPQQPNAPQKPQGQATSRLRLADMPECVDDIKHLCSKSSTTNNFGVLECLQSDVQGEDDVSSACQHVVWQYKHNMSLDYRFDMANREVCKDSLALIPECHSLTPGQGLIIPCLIENRKNVTGDSCKQFLNKMSSIIFSDYRFISNFAEACKADIDRTQCGRLHPVGDDAPHSQGKTVECLSEKVGSLMDDCKHQILRVAELQSDDFHEDRPLYYACRDDRERYCARTKAGSGRVYRCLYRHKFEKDMSSACTKQLTRRQQLMQQDYKVNKGLADSCRADIKTYRCLKGAEITTKHGRLSSILLCLEGAQRDGDPVTPECMGELREMRRSLMEDYKISPNLVQACETEIQDKCRGLERNGKTLHCLMDLARPKRSHNGQFQMSQDINLQCRAELERLIKEADAGEDIRVDPYLSESCQPVIESVCHNIKAGDARMIECLMENLNSNHMTDDCEERLIELQYFVARDFKLDPRLYKLCRKDATKLCSAPQNWDDAESMAPEQGPRLFSCLYNHLKRPSNDLDMQISRPCAFEVRRIMRERAVSVDLEPRIEEPCLFELGQYCSEEVEKGEEIECLQDNMEDLSDECRWAVGNFTQDVDEDPHLDQILMKACSKPIKDFCEDLLDDEGTEPGDLMECLIKHKDNKAMDRKCRVGIEHHQLITLTDFRFSYKFKEACKDDVMANCRNARKKAEVVRCLSEIVRNDTLLEEDHRLSRSCRKQLKFELLARAETIDLDPELKESCGNDIDQMCHNVSPGEAAIIDCLKSHQKKLSSACRSKIFKREELEAKDPSIAFHFVMDCKRMIKRYCPKEEPTDLLKCLKEYRDDIDFDDNCRQAIKTKMIEENKDIRLNPELNAACKMDMNKFCSDELKRRSADEDFEGVIINCLKKQFPIRRLSKNCEDHIAADIREAAEDIRMDPVLSKACSSEIHDLCRNKNSEDVEECLKAKFSTGEIRNEKCRQEVTRLLSEARADIHVDPMLHKACAMDIKHYCFDVPAGEGRQMSCMLSALEDKTIRMSIPCRKMLQERVEMWEYAAKIAPPETAQQLLEQITTSKSRNYFALLIFSMIGVIFFGGICCGRVTKRVRAELKNR